MKEKRVADSDGLHLYGWMRNVLHLTGGELITFAIVFRSAQSNTGIYTGGIPYVAEFVGCSKETARKYLHSLEHRGLIVGEDIDKNGVRYRNYQIVDNHIPKNFGYTPKNIGGDTQKIDGGIPKNFGIEEYNKKNKEKNNTPIPPTVEQVEDYARSKGFADPRGFAEYYIAYQTENGWQTGKGKNRKPIDNWKLNVLSWLPNHKTQVFPKSKGRAAEMPLEHFNSMFQ